MSEYALSQDSKVILRLLGRVSVRSRKSLQKLIYLLQKAERVPLGLDYRMYHYGPYCRELDHKIRMLELLGLVEVDRDINDIPNYRLAESIVSSLEADPEIDPKLERIVRKFGNRTPNDLELLTSVYYLASAHEGVAVDEDRLFQDVVAWKGHKFARQQLQSALNELRELGYLAAA
jgi:uncharacterized protein YwgA